MRVCVALLLALLTTPALAAECVRPSNTVERIICGTPALLRADADLSALYARVRAATPYPVALDDAQQGWLRTRNAARGVDAIAETYNDRAQELAALATQLDAIRQSIAPEGLGTTCLKLREDGNPDEDSCTVIGFGPVEGDLVYQLQDWVEDPAHPGAVTGGGVVVLRARGDRLTPVAWASGEDAQYETPRIVRNDEGAVLLVLTGRADGDLARNAGRVLQQQGNVWQEVDDLSWLADLRRRLPRGTEIRRGIFPDYAELHAETPLWLITDADTDTPTGGVASIELTLRRNQVLIRDVQVER